MYWLHLETTHFYFDAFGHTKQEAMDMLVAGLQRHGEQYDCTPGWYTDYVDGWLETHEFPFPSCVRDRYRTIAP